MRSDSPPRKPWISQAVLGIVAWRGAVGSPPIMEPRKLHLLQKRARYVVRVHISNVRRGHIFRCSLPPPKICTAIQSQSRKANDLNGIASTLPH
jgi:hypothetical protein